MLFSTPIPYSSNAEEYFAAIVDLPWAVWLDSGGGGRYDILAAQPIATLVTHGSKTEINDEAGRRISTEDSFVLLREQIGPPLSNIDGIPFCGGVLGYWAYDLSRRWIQLSENDRDLDGLPDMVVGIYDWSILIDHQEQEARLVSRLRRPETAKILPAILERIQKSNVRRKDDFQITGPIKENLARSGYNAAFEKIYKYLIEGDCYQVNLSQRFSATASGDAFAAYLSLRKIAPAPYSAFLNFPQVQILSASPERFLCVQDGLVETKPIKGTRMRGTDADHDERLIEDLRNSAKDRAENLMIVDLLRNDLSKSCETGSVEVKKLFEVESFSNVHHLVSTITGKLKTGKDALSLLQDCFPGGSITGAPKQRAMEIIEQLEPQERGVYCGSIGYIGWDDKMDTNIAIRTLIYAKGEIHCSVGGGIVADSNAEEEYQETLDKAAGMLQMIELYRNKKQGM